MVSTLISQFLRVRVTVAYAVILICVTTTMSALDPTARDWVIRHASTNLHNLSHGRVATVLDSAFVVDAGAIYEWLPGLVCLLGLAELLWGSGRLVIVFAVSHVAATVLVAVWLTTAVEMAWLPPTVARATDVGMSYGAVTVLGSLTPAIRRPWRPIWAGWWLAVAGGVVALGDDFTNTGHAVALILGMLVASRFRAPRRWTSARAILLTVAAAFGYLLLASAEPVLAAAGAGAVGASLGALVAVCRHTPFPARRQRPAVTRHAGPSAQIDEPHRCNDQGPQQHGLAVTRVTESPWL
jgi:hypothetical protein